MAQTALRTQIMLRTATPRLPPEAISYGGCPADGARHVLCPSGEVCAVRLSWNAENIGVDVATTRAYDPAVTVRVLKQMAELDTRARCIFTSNIPQRPPSRALITLSTGLLETATVTAPVV
jgi:hypothetical protein